MPLGHPVCFIQVMKQLIQNLKTGETSLLEVPVPAPAAGQVLVRVSHSVLSPGTERMLLDFGKAGWLGKIRQQPERVQEVLRKVRTDGPSATLDAVRAKLDREIPLGNAAAGTVVAVGAGVTRFRVGDRVACNGSHAAFVSVSQNLCVSIPDSIGFETAAFTVMGAIALQGIRLLQTSLGERVVVYGLGLIGQLAVQLLRASGCRVYAVDPDPGRCAAAERAGAQVYCNRQQERVAAWIAAQSGDVDAVLITASAQGDSIVSDAAAMCRKRGKIVLTGVVNTHLSRNDFYKKELSFSVSSAYGAGRYEQEYEQGLTDYPEAYLRWTAARNMAAVVDTMLAGQLDPLSLSLPQFDISEYEQAYKELLNHSIPGAVFTYPPDAPLSQLVRYPASAAVSAEGIAVIGAGNFATRIVLPALRKTGLSVSMIVSEHGLSAAQTARKFGITSASSQINHALDHPGSGVVFLLTPHHQHANLACEALLKGKHVFVEKPLAISREELDAVAEAYRVSSKWLHVGYNRRFAPLSLKAKVLMGAAPVHVSVMVNAGKSPDSGWLSDRLQSGGRLVGEVCHFVDLVSFFCDAPVAAVCAQSPGRESETVSLQLRMRNGSTATIQYITEGHPAYPKERIELFGSGKVIVIDNWRRLKGFGVPSSGLLPGKQDKGHEAQFAQIAQLIRIGGSAPISFDSLYNTSATTFAALDSLRDACWKELT